MNRAIITVAAFACLVTCILPGANVAAGDSELVKGTIKEVRQERLCPSGEKRVSILVERSPNENIVFHLRKDTALIYSDKQKAEASNLKVGQRVSVHTSSGYDDSKPQQAEADKIVIDREGKSK